jgi:hypothetical protein
MRPFRVFDCDTLSVLGEVYDSALASIHLAARAPVVGDTMAIRLLEAAREGDLGSRALAPCRARRPWVPIVVGGRFHYRGATP